MVCAGGGSENVWDGSKNAGVFEKTTEMAGRCWWGVEKCATFKMQAVEAANLRVFVGMVKGDAELKLSHSMLKYNGLFVAPNLSGNVIAFMGDSPLEGRPWVFKMPRENPWAWPEIKFLINSIEMQTHFRQEGNSHAMWYTIEKTNLTTR